LQFNFMPSRKLALGGMAGMRRKLGMAQPPQVSAFHPNCKTS